MGRNILTNEGKDKRGVTLLTGNVDDVPVTAIVFLFLVSIGMAAGSIGTLLDHEYRGSTIFAIVGIVFAGMGRYNFRLRRRLRQLDTAYMIRKKVGVSKEEFDLLLATSDVKPVYCVNGIDLYDYADFGEKATLLRASMQAAASSQMLLRPAADADQTQPEQLLRAGRKPGL